MTVDDSDPPIHRISRVEDRERILAEALAEAEERDQQYRITFDDGPPPARWKLPVALVGFALAAVLAVFPPGFTSPPPLPAPNPAQLDRGLRIALYLQARQVAVFQARRGRLPADLAEVPIRLPGLRFVRSNSRVYQIVGDRADGSTLVFDSARPTPGLDQAVLAWLGPGEP